MPRVDGDPPPPPADDRKERLAINFWDLETVHPLIRGAAVGDKLDLRREAIVRADPGRAPAKGDDTAVPFTCPLLVAATAADVVRSEARKVGDPPPRVYVCRAKAWVRLPATAVLTAVENGAVVLAAEWFPRPVELVPYVPPPARRVVF